MKNLPLVLIAVLSIGIGIWFGLQGVGPGSGNSQSEGYKDLGGEFTLDAESGKVSLSDYKGKVVPIYFGYTHCPDVCITSLNKVTAALKTMDDAERAEIQPLFITVDPERDTPEKVGAYARYFEPSIVGLTGTQEQIARVAKQYFVIYEKVANEKSAMDYSMDHSSIIYVVGHDGVIKSLVHHADTAEALVEYLREALKG